VVENRRTVRATLRSQICGEETVFHGGNHQAPVVSFTAVGFDQRRAILLSQRREAPDEIFARGHRALGIGWLAVYNRLHFEIVRQTACSLSFGR
jgi:hypothetical protein